MSDEYIRQLIQETDDEIADAFRFSQQSGYIAGNMIASSIFKKWIMLKIELYRKLGIIEDLK